METNETIASSFKEDLQKLGYSLSRLIALFRIRDRSPLQFRIKRAAIRMHLQNVGEALHAMALRPKGFLRRALAYQIQWEIRLSEKILRDSQRNIRLPRSQEGKASN